MKFGWKLVSTYFALVFAFLLILSNMIQGYMLDSNLDAKKSEIFKQLDAVTERFYDTYYTMNRIEVDKSYDGIIRTMTENVPGRIIVFSSANHVVLDTEGEWKGKELEVRVVKEAINSKQKMSERYYTNDNNHLLYTVAPLTTRDGQTGAILHVENITSMYSSIDDIVKQLFIFGLAFIVISSIIVYFATIQIYRPLEQIQEGVDQMTRGNYSHRIDISYVDDELKQISKSFNTMASRLNEIDERQSELLSNVSHELKTPISSMKIITQSLVDAKDNVEKEVIFDFLNDISMESDRLSEIINDLLFMAKLDRVDMKLKLELKPLSQVLDQSVRMITPLAKEKDIDIVFTERTSIVVEYDFNKMKQVFINLLMNAVKYTEPGGTVTVRMEENKWDVVVSVQDTGIGIPEADLPYVFDRFFRVDKHRARKEGGSGLGLNIVNRIVNLHEGSIEVTSEVNQGSIFTIRIPKRYQV